MLSSILNGVGQNYDNSKLLYLIFNGRKKNGRKDFIKIFYFLFDPFKDAPRKLKAKDSNQK